MIRNLLLLALLALVVLPAGAAAPTDPPPNVEGTKGEPPPAWAVGSGTDTWLAYSSFCWRTTCVTFLPPNRRDDVPTVKARRGAFLVIHLGFDPRWVKVRHLASGTSFPLVAAAVTRWRVRRAGLISIETRGSGGTASYLARVDY